jgi:hypothetical protein
VSRSRVKVSGPSPRASAVETMVTAAYHPGPTPCRRDDTLSPAARPGGDFPGAEFPPGRASPRPQGAGRVGIPPQPASGPTPTPDPPERSSPGSPSRRAPLSRRPGSTRISSSAARRRPSRRSGSETTGTDQHGRLGHRPAGTADRATARPARMSVPVGAAFHRPGRFLALCAQRASVRPGVVHAGRCAASSITYVRVDAAGITLAR